MCASAWGVDVCVGCVSVHRRAHEPERVRACEQECVWQGACEGTCVCACFSPGTEAVLQPGLALWPAAMVDSSPHPTPRPEGPSPRPTPLPTAQRQNCPGNAVEPPPVAFLVLFQRILCPHDSHWQNFHPSGAGQAQVAEEL